MVGAKIANLSHGQKRSDTAIAVTQSDVPAESVPIQVSEQNESQRGMVAAKLANLGDGQRADQAAQICAPVRIDRRCRVAFIGAAYWHESCGSRIVPKETINHAAAQTVLFARGCACVCMYARALQTTIKRQICRLKLMYAHTRTRVAGTTPPRWCYPMAACRPDPRNRSIAVLRHQPDHVAVFLPYRNNKGPPKRA